MYAGNSPIGENAGERTHSNVWRDTSEEEMYGSYLGPGANDAGSDVPMMRPTMNARPSTAIHQEIAVGQLDLDESAAGAGARKSYSGRKVVWPGALFLLVVSAAALALIAYFGVEQYNSAQSQQALTESATEVDSARKSTSVKSCLLPDYVTSNGKIYATDSRTGDKEQLVFTGINWSGMENAEGVPHGLATKQSYLDDIAANLSDNGFNAVRLPLNAQMVIDNSAPNTKLFVNSLDTDLNVDTYIDMIKKVVQGLGKQQIGVLLDIHKIDPNFTDDTSEHLWYTDDYPIATIYKMYETLATELCSDLEYNIIGIDLKNEPVGGCWPEDDTDDYCDADVNWPRAVETIGNKILAICPNWLIVAEGNYMTSSTTEINGVNVTYNDWYGASLQNASINPIKLDTTGKLVFAPHFYSPSVYPSSYFFKKQSSSGDTVSVTEYPNTTAGNELLKAALTAVLDNAFGNAVTEAGVPTFYGEFGGIYGSAELLEGLTSTRVIEMLIEYANDMNMTGGFAWAINPDGSYDFNDEYKPDDPWQYGLYTSSSWDAYHTDFATGLQNLKGSGSFPCFSKVTTVTSSTSGSGSATITVDSTTSSGSSATATTTTTSTAGSTTSSGSSAAATTAATTTTTSTASSSATATAV
ncbi:cellulase-7, endo-1,4-beta-glucanase [Phytophthora sojae]|uniref:Cellulase-7, endo-1,4-beta-glucanase n=2 Tax=Phytophthora sojae TaxID=67593 RepID=G4Z8D8_PHYSP|nr:cellulase-7, endo-1,4-beta-glucanase [Phytophthora sojae]ABL75347.1 cell 5A endo-1,4-betaglucanase [Phytophthora sojae]EGZ21858.1 cellulase-7, endo-1,4-beta-glucanase [Phytophthora sojae]|eukprot:XP_009524575.1 cellulase-7, endo-1,4-beta-glucanase [Phytophthora sojae]